MVRADQVSIVGAVLLAGCSSPAPRESAFTATGEVIAFSGGEGGATHACATCHSLRGKGDGRNAPRLAGLDAGYMARQSDDYANGRREHTAMREVAAELSGEARLKVSRYYAVLPYVVPPVRWAQATGAAAALYQRGDAARARRLRVVPRCGGRGRQSRQSAARRAA